MKIVGDWATGKKYTEIAVCNDLVLANLEGPVLSKDTSLSPIPKAGPSLFSCELPNGVSNFIFSLANNHTMDYGVPGLNITLKTLRQRNMRFCGAGKTIQEARSPLIVQDNDVVVGIISCCEAQFGIARQGQAGVSEFGPWIYRTIGDLREQVDAVIISVHAGMENNPWPSPYIRDLYRSYIDAGATLVHGHHTHMPQGYEQYRGGIIFYGMGNFAVDPEIWNDFLNGTWSLGADIQFQSGLLQPRLTTYEICHRGNSAKIFIEESSHEEFERHQQYLELCNRPLHNDALLEALWQEVAIRAYYAYGGKYMNFLNPPDYSRLRQIKDTLSQIRQCIVKGDLKKSLEKQRILLYYVMLTCESHRQMLSTALGVLSGEIDDFRNDETRRLADEMTSLRRNESYSNDK